MIATRIIRTLIIFLLAILMLVTACTPQSTPTTPEGPTQYTLSTSVSPSGSGSISTASGTYDEGTVVTLEAIPESGWSFIEWNGAEGTLGYNAESNNYTFDIIMDSDKSVTARFGLTPIAQLSVNLTTVRVGEEVSFSAEGSTDPDGDIVSYDWNFDYYADAMNYTASGMTVTHSYSDLGNHYVILTAKDNDGLFGAALAEVLVVSGIIKVEITESDDMICYSPYSNQDSIVRMLESENFGGYEGNGDYDARLVINCRATRSGSYGGTFGIPAYSGTDLHYTMKLYIGSKLLYEDTMDASTSSIVDCGDTKMIDYCLCANAVANLGPKFEDSFAKMIETAREALSPES
jgi:hypothetical protein